MLRYEEFAVREQLDRLVREMSEAVGPVEESIEISLMLSAPTIVEMSGSLLRRIGRKVDQPLLTKIGTALDEYGMEMSVKLVKLVELAIKPLIFWMSVREQENAAKAVLLAVVAFRLVNGSDAIVALERNTISFLEKALAAMDVKDLLAAARGMAPQLRAVVATA